MDDNNKSSKLVSHGINFLNDRREYGDLNSRSSRESCSLGIFEKRIASNPHLSLEPVIWLTTSEAASYLRLSISSIKTMIYRGQIRVHKLGRRNRFLKEELERLIVPPSY